MRKDAGNLGFVSVDGHCVRFAAERKSYRRFYIKAVVSGSCVRVGKIVRLSVSRMFFYNKNLLRKILKEVGDGRIGFVDV